MSSRQIAVQRALWSFTGKLWLYFADNSCSAVKCTSVKLFCRMESIEKMESDFKNCHMFLVTVLNKAVCRGSFPHCKYMRLFINLYLLGHKLYYEYILICPYILKYLVCERYSGKREALLFNKFNHYFWSMCTILYFL